MPATTEPPVIKFKGLNNRGDPTALGWAWQVQADNAACDDAGYLTTAPGPRAVATDVIDAYGTYDGRLFVIGQAGALTEILAGGDRVDVAVGLVGGPFSWAEMGDALFLMSSTHAYVVYPTEWVRWGHYCPIPDHNLFPVAPKRAYPPPLGGPICTRRTQMVVSVYEPEQDRSVLYFSRPGLPHEFYLDTDFLLIPGHVRLLASTAKGLVIGTERAIYLDAVDAPLERAATYGVPAGASAHSDLDQVYFWTHRGLCRAFPFENLTDAAWVPPMMARASTSLLYWQGSRYVAVALAGGRTPDAPRRPFVPLALIP